MKKVAGMRIRLPVVVGVRGMDVQAVATVGEGPIVRRRWGRASGRRERERERCMGRGQPLDGAREAERRERGDGKGRVVISLKMTAWLWEWGR
jgi:hypothetical protein